MFRSVAFPGWGQLANHKYAKSALVFGAEGYLIYRAVHAGVREHDARESAKQESDREDSWLALADKYNGERRDYTWWTVFAVILSMGDAYVDAALGDFEVEFEPEPDGTAVRAGLRFQWDQ
ncbi:MAG: hypothetical protein KC729_17300 [Candidatus Eisenbacteria bacterium]|uniref:DUF5683 domain-containing protein n=1 Tax=Eiseniibacteriota bacterium TaxID=2212470 RepID=A0A956RQM8_UNCEI|nr:hypothetical protein [Candidatus Eisenbacteria bacterium]